MSTVGQHAPVPAVEHAGLVRANGVGDATSLVTIYIVLLFGIPSNVTINGLGSLGRPALLWGLVLFAFWMLSRLQWRNVDVDRISQPVRIAFVVYLVIVLVSFSAAMLRGQPADQISPAMSWIVSLVSSAGVLLVILDGVKTMRDVTRLLRRIGIGVTLLAVLAFLQVLTAQYLLDFWGSVPGFTLGFGGVAERNGQIRASATATHPLELVTTLNAGLSICVAAALSRGFRSRGSGGSGFWWWVATAMLALVALTGLSRSAMIGFVVAVVAMFPAVPRRHRLSVLAGGVLLVGALIAVVPGLAGATTRLFTGVAEDGSTLSRTDALARLTEFMSGSPLIGVGSGTFLPRYYIFDNQWAITAIELGVLGVTAFAAIFATAMWSAWDARRRSTSPDVWLAAHALAASVLIIGLLFAFFDGLAFPIAGGLLFVLVGLCGAIRTVAVADAGHPVWGDQLEVFPAPPRAESGRPLAGAEPLDSTSHVVRSTTRRSKR